MRMSPIFSVDSVVTVPEGVPEGFDAPIALRKTGQAATQSWPLFLSVAVHLLVLLALGYRSARPTTQSEAPLVFFDIAPPPALGIEGAPAPRARPHSQKKAPTATQAVTSGQATKPEETQQPESAKEDLASRNQPSPPANRPVAEPSGQPKGSTEGVGQALKLSQVAQPPRVLERITPDYPRSAKSVGLEGLVVVRVILDAEGRIERLGTRIVRSIPALDSAALEAIARWRFSPALGADLRPVRVQLDVPFQFSLR